MKPFTTDWKVSSAGRMVVLRIDSTRTFRVHAAETKRRTQRRRHETRKRQISTTRPGIGWTGWAGDSKLQHPGETGRQAGRQAIKPFGFPLPLDKPRHLFHVLRKTNTRHYFVRPRHTQGWPHAYNHKPRTTERNGSTGRRARGQGPGRGPGRGGKRIRGIATIARKRRICRYVARA